MTYFKSMPGKSVVQLALQSAFVICFMCKGLKCGGQTENQGNMGGRQVRQDTRIEYVALICRVHLAVLFFNAEFGLTCVRIYVAHRL